MEDNDMVTNFKNRIDELKLRQVVLERYWNPEEQKRLLNFYIRILPQLIGAERCRIFTIDPNDKTVWLKAGTDIKERKIEVPSEPSIAGEVIQSGKPVRRDHLDEKPGVHKKTDEATGFTTRELLCVPIHGIRKTQVIGAIELQNKGSGVFSEDDQELLSEAAHNLSPFIENIYLNLQVATPSGKLYKTGENVLRMLVFIFAAGLGVLLLIFMAWAFIPRLTG
jgi:GAF domain-containing protein